MQIKRWALLGILLIAIPNTIRAQDVASPPNAEATQPKADQESATDSQSFQEIADQLVQLRRELQPKLNEAIEAIRAAENDSELRQQAMQTYQELQLQSQTEIKRLGNQVRGLIEKDPTADDVFPMLQWLLTYCQQDAELSGFAKSTLIAHHLENDGIKELIPTITSSPSKETLEFLGQLAKTGTDEVKATAWISRIELLTRYHEQAKMILEQAINLPESTKSFFEASSEFDLETTEAELNSLVEQFAAVEYRDSTVEKYAKSKLKSIENQKNLQVGKIAPDIEGLDLDGVNFKLSDYRGKVVMLDFWGDW